MSFTIKNTSDLLRSRGLNEGGAGQKACDSEVISVMTPYTPKETGALIMSATRLTKIGSGLIRQGGSSAPYGRRWYYEPANFNGAPMRGNYWFSRSMQAGGKQRVLNAVRRAIK